MSKHIQTGQQRGGSPIVFKSGEPVSVICVASTFTSLSYANNGGKVQITSTGVHGLTTSPAVGAKVYVSWSGGTGVSGLYTVLSVDSTTAITVDATYVAGLGTPTVAIAGTEITLQTINLPVLSKNSSLLLWNEWTMTASANSKTCVIRLNGAVVQYQNIASNHTLARFNTRLSNKGSTSVQSIVEMPMNLASGVWTMREATQNTSVSTPISIRGRCATANEIIKLEMYLIEVFI